MMKTVSTFILLLVICISAHAQFAFEKDKHYTVVADQKTSKPEVKEFFSLFCSHCFQFEPFMDSLQTVLPSDLKLIKSHVSYLPKDNPEMQQLIMRAFLTMRVIDKEKEFIKQFFAAYHIKQVDFKTQEDLKQLFVANGVTEERFEEIMTSPEVAKMAESMDDLWLEKQIESVPTIVVNGKYRVNMVKLKSLDELKAITLELLSKD